MNAQDRMSLSMRLKEAAATIAEINDGLACGSAPIAMLSEADRLCDLACELTATLNRLSAPTGSAPFDGGHVVIDGLASVPQIGSDADRQAQRDMAERHLQRSA